MQPPLLRPLFHDPPPPSEVDIISGGPSLHLALLSCRTPRTGRPAVSFLLDMARARLAEIPRPLSGGGARNRSSGSPAEHEISFAGQYRGNMKLQPGGEAGRALQSGDVWTLYFPLKRQIK